MIKLILFLCLLCHQNILLASSFKKLPLKEKLFKETLTNRHSQKINYRLARRYLFGKLHLRKNGKGEYYIKDLYCQKIFKEDIGVGPMSIPNHRLINCEHTWPQSRFNKNFSISLQKNDLHHLYPVDARANSTRLNDIFAEVENEKPVSNHCPLSSKGRSIINAIVSFEPPDSHKGNIARAIFYFSIRYKSPISETEELYLRKWHEDDPVDSKEKKRNQQIMKFQNNRNPFIDHPNLVGKIYDF